MAAKSQQRAYHFSLITRGIRALRLAGVNLQAVLGDHAERLGKSSFACARPEFEGAAVCSLAPFCRAESQPYQAIIAPCTVRCASSVVPAAKLTLVASMRAEVKFFKPDGTLSRSASLQGQGDPVHLRVIRSELTRQVIKEAQRMHPEAIKIHFDTLVEHVDLKGQMLHASSAGSTNIDKV